MLNHSLFECTSIPGCFFHVNIIITYYKRVHRSEFMQEGFTRLWRGTNASLALAMPSVSYLSCLEFFHVCYFRGMIILLILVLQFCMFITHLVIHSILMVWVCFLSNRLEFICLVMISSATLWRSIQLKILQI